MKTNIVRIGNSRGIRIPKALLEQCHLEEEVELQASDHGLVIRSLSSKRRGWAEAFKKMSGMSDDSLIDRNGWPQTEWDRSEWKW